jgi:hypothetical protein
MIFGAGRTAVVRCGMKDLTRVAGRSGNYIQWEERLMVCCTTICEPGRLIR